MQPFTVHRGLVVTMDRSDVDTDQIIPKQFLKRIERTGFEDFLFYDWRFEDDGTLRAPHAGTCRRQDGVSGNRWWSYEGYPVGSQHQQHCLKKDYPQTSHKIKKDLT